MDEILGQAAIRYFPFSEERKIADFHILLFFLQ
jgi:hypothetical protein